MDNTINNDIIQKVVIQKTAIYKAIAMLPPIETKDLWEEKNLIEHQKNCENKNVSETNDTMNETKTNSTLNDWRDITDPKLKRKMRYEQNKESIKAKSRERYALTKDKLRETRKKYYQSTKNNKRKEYLRLNADKRKDQLRSRYNSDVNYKLKVLLRRRLSLAIDRDTKCGSAVNDLGCSILEFKSYIESKFQPGMSWDNWSKDGWHIDHIKPLVSFDLSDRKQLLEACHYTNLQPLWANENLSKGSNIT